MPLVVSTITGMIGKSLATPNAGPKMNFSPLKKKTVKYFKAVAIIEWLTYDTSAKQVLQKIIRTYLWPLL